MDWVVVMRRMVAACRPGRKDNYSSRRRGQCAFRTLTRGADRVGLAKFVRPFWLAASRSPSPRPLPLGEGTPHPALRRIQALRIGASAVRNSPSPQGRGRGEGEQPDRMKVIKPRCVDNLALRDEGPFLVFARTCKAVTVTPHHRNILAVARASLS